jgi:hypothetical protein
MWLFAARPPANVQVKASFEPELNGISCVFLNDAKGPYTTSKTGVSVWITGDLGEMYVQFDHHSDRSMRILFPYFHNDCGWLPDTTGAYPDLPYEPIDFFRFQTLNSDAYAGPKINLLTMPCDTPTQIRLWTTICTTQRHYFFMNFMLDYRGPTGLVEVTAYDTVGNDGKPDKWDIHTVPNTGDVARIYKHPETGDDSINCFFGEFPIPFHLILVKR